MNVSPWLSASPAPHLRIVPKIGTAKMGARKAGQGSKWIRKSSRLAIYHRDGFCCVYCGAAAEEGERLTLDHLVACELGGTNSHTNLVTACRSCNSAKQDLTKRAWLKRLRSRGIDASKVARRIRTLVRRPLNRTEGRRLATIRKVRQAS